MTKLDRNHVIRAALDLLNEVGIDGLTTRRLAERLNVQQPALYWHFRSKQALLDALAEAMLAERHNRPRPAQGENWRDFLKANARSFRQALLAYRDGARIHAGTRPTTSQYEAIEAQVRFLCDAGMSPKNAALALAAIGHYTVGAVLEEQANASDSATRIDENAPLAAPPILRDAFRAVEEAGADGAFEYGLDAFIAGLRAGSVGT